MESQNVDTTFYFSMDLLLRSQRKPPVSAHHQRTMSSLHKLSASKRYCTSGRWQKAGDFQNFAEHFLMMPRLVQQFYKATTAPPPNNFVKIGSLNGIDSISVTTILYVRSMQ